MNGQQSALRPPVEQTLDSMGNPPEPAPSSSQPISDERLIKVFNTAIISTHADPKRNFNQELQELLGSPAFRAILNATRQHALQSGLDDREAAEEIIRTFRAMDEIWRDYVFREGMKKIRAQTGKPTSPAPFSE